MCCFDIRFNQMLFPFADNIIHEQIDFAKKYYMYFFTLFKTNIRLEPCLHNNEFLYTFASRF